MQCDIWYPYVTLHSGYKSQAANELKQFFICSWLRLRERYPQVPQRGTLSSRLRLRPLEDPDGRTEVGPMIGPTSDRGRTDDRTDDRTDVVVTLT